MLYTVRFWKIVVQFSDDNVVVQYYSFETAILLDLWPQ